MTNNRKFITDKEAAASPLETAVVVGIIGVVLAFSLASANNVFVSYDTNMPDAYAKNIHVSDRVVTETGADANNDRDWGDTIQEAIDGGVDPAVAIQNLDVFGLSMKPLLLNIVYDEDGNAGHILAYLDTAALNIFDQGSLKDYRLELGPIIGDPTYSAGSSGTLDGVESFIFGGNFLGEGCQVGGTGDSLDLGGDDNFVEETIEGNPDPQQQGVGDDDDDAGQGTSTGGQSNVAGSAEEDTVNYIFAGWTNSHFTNVLYPIDIILQTKLESDMYGCLDQGKTDLLKNYNIDYDTIVEKLGFGSDDNNRYKVHINIANAETGEEILTYGDQADDSSQIISTFQRSLSIFDDKASESPAAPAIFTLTLYSEW